MIEKTKTSGKAENVVPDEVPSLASDPPGAGQPGEMCARRKAMALPQCTPVREEEFSDLSPDTPQPKDHRPIGLTKRLYDLVYRSLVEPLVLSRNPPWLDARGVALGLVVGFGIPMGGHCVALGLLRLLLRFNFVIAIGVAAVVNPLNIIPLYYGYYCLGSVILGKPIALDRDVFEKLMNPILEKSHFWEGIRAFMELGADIVGRWAISAVVVATILGIAGYVVTVKIQKQRCKRAAKKLGIRYEEFLLQLEKNSIEESALTVASSRQTGST
jgi:uncharacterized protein